MVRRSGIVVRFAQDRDKRVSLGFLPTERVEAVVRMPRLSPVTGSRPPMLGVASVLGGILPVVTLGSDARHQTAAPGSREAPKLLVVCLLAGERLGIANVDVVSVGHFDAAEAGVRMGGELVTEVDLASVAAELHARPWAGRVRA